MIDLELGFMRSRYSVRIAYALAAFATPYLITGCNSGPTRPETVTVNGKATLDGEPLSGVTVVFQPAQPSETVISSSGSLQGDGTFQLTTFEQFDGATPGEFTVMLQPDATLMKSPPAVKPQTVTISKEGYTASSPLVINFEGQKGKKGASSAMIGPRP